MKAQLVPLDGGPPIDIVKDVTVVGRSDKVCDLHLEARSVSKLHCVLVKTDGLLFVRDLGSTNGTKVNRQKVRRAALLPGDHLSVGGQKFRVHFGPEQSKPVEAERTEMLTSLPDSATEPVAPGQKPRRSTKEPREPLISAPGPAAKGSKSGSQALGGETEESSIIPLLDENDEG